VERGFTAGCMRNQGSATLSVCRCVTQWFEKRYSYPTVYSMYLHDRTRAYTIAARAVSACLSK
jgi:hypothetical protein